MPYDTDYQHTKAKSLILCGPNSNPKPKLYIWDVDIKAEILTVLFVGSEF